MDVPPDAEGDVATARVLTLTAILLQGAVAAVVLALLVAFLPGALSLVWPPSLEGMVANPLAFLLLLAAVGATFLGILWAALAFFLVYAPLREGRVEHALTPALAIGLLTLVFGLVLPGIFLILAYVKARDAHTKMSVAGLADG